MFTKRGQVTIFVILGILAVVVIGIVFLMYGERLKFEAEKEVEFDAAQLEPLKNFVEDCIDIHGDEVLNLVAKQGGDVNPKQPYQYYQDDKMSYLCYTEEFAPCVSRRPFLKTHIEEQITSYLTQKLDSCINLDLFRGEGFNVQAEQLKVTTTIGEKNIIIDVDYPIKIIKGGTEISENKFSKTFDVPLSRLIKVAEDIVESEILYGQFFHQIYMRQYTDVLVEPHTIESTFYKVKLHDHPYTFQFAIKSWVIPS